ncbi:MAG: alpha/beta hydrolase [Flavobacteriales bacterium]|nr:alpha/beta hydrolase [Flavobacteriales bacterium]
MESESKRKKVYLISGLGADSRLFKYQLELDYDFHKLEWIKAMRGETLADYAKRMSAGIDESEPYSIVGCSMGGIVAIEMSKFLNPDKVVLISSLKTKDEKSWITKVASSLKLYYLLSGHVFKWASILRRMFLGRLNEEEEKLFDAMLRAADPFFMKWGLHRVITWNNEQEFSNVVHIHGDKDSVFPFGNIKNVICIPGGSHLMILNRAEEVNVELVKALG